MHTEILEQDEVVGMRYAVRLLHRSQEDGGIVGVVESVESGTNHVFINRDELWTILMHADDDPAGEMKPDRMLDK